MTAICPGGVASQPKAGYAGTIQLSAVVLGALAINWPVLWAAPYLVGLEAIVLNLPTFCALDPPADPGFTAADGLAMLGGPAGDQVAKIVASNKLRQLIQRFAWYQFCDCIGATTPAPPAAPAAPVGLPDPNPAVPGLASGQCQQDVGSYGPWSSGANAAIVKTSDYFRPVAGQTAMIAELTHTIAGAGAHSDLIVYLQTCQTEACGLGSFTSVNTTLVQGQHRFWTLPTSKTDVKYLLTATPASGAATTDTIAAKVTQYCGGQAPGTPGPCCPTDPILTVMLQQILTTVNLIQRQNVPFAYVTGAVHTGLTAYGTLTISGLLGIRVDITAGLATLRKVGNLPGYYYGGGFVTFGTADGYPSSYRIKHSPLLCMPARCSAYTQLEYDLPPGVTISITELVREP